jgi:hypothetical protein
MRGLFLRTRENGLLSLVPTHKNLSRMHTSETPYRSPQAHDAPLDAGPGVEMRLRLDQRQPALCAICGASTTIYRNVLFRKTFGELAHIVYSRVPFCEGVQISLPLCYEHRNFRRWWPSSAAVPLAFLVILASLLGAVILLRKTLTFSFTAILISSIAMALYFLSNAIKTAFRIRATRVNRSAIVLRRVAAEYAKACEDIDAAESTSVIGRFLEENER